MNWFLNLNTRAKLMASFGTACALLVVVVGTAYWSLNNLADSQRRLYEAEFADATDFWALRAHENGVRASLLQMVLTTNVTELNTWHSDIKQRSTAIEELLSKLEARHRTDPVKAPRIRELASDRRAFAETRDTQIIPLTLEGRQSESMGLILGVQLERYKKMRSTSEELGQEAVANAANAVDAARALADGSKQLLVIVALAALGLSVTLALYLGRIIADPLAEMTRVANSIAEGDVTQDVRVQPRSDEVGLLMQTFSGMTRNLRQTALTAQQVAAGNLNSDFRPQSERDVLGNSIATMLVNLRQITRENLEATNVLATSASEILATTTQVASSAAETATALSETTTTIEEVKQTAQVSNEKARQLSDDAQKSARTAQVGRQAVEASVEGMHRIQEQMNSIAETVVRLSEQSQAIGEIVATVTDLAEQSNLLAVNAAIEAARAGEHGRGFAVVAQEVKSLADQSKQATGQVRTILNDIQKAISTAVMATEQGSKTVEAGVQQGGEAGEAIRALAETIEAGAQAAMQIAASSQQQTAGMDQVASAMENIKTASSQNVAGTKQAESAARNLHDVGQKLKQLVERYRV
jgi:methyl-accepting chemotaxis protein